MSNLNDIVKQANKVKQVIEAAKRLAGRGQDQAKELIGRGKAEAKELVEKGKDFLDPGRFRPAGASVPGEAGGSINLNAPSSSGLSFGGPSAGTMYGGTSIPGLSSSASRITGGGDAEALLAASGRSFPGKVTGVPGPTPPKALRALQLHGKEVGDSVRTPTPGVNIEGGPPSLGDVSQLGGGMGADVTGAAGSAINRAGLADKLRQQAANTIGKGKELGARGVDLAKANPRLAGGLGAGAGLGVGAGVYGLTRGGGEAAAPALAAAGAVDPGSLGTALGGVVSPEIKDTLVKALGTDGYSRLLRATGHAGLGAGLGMGAGALYSLFNPSNKKKRLRSLIMDALAGGAAGGLAGGVVGGFDPLANVAQKALGSMGLGGK